MCRKHYRMRMSMRCGSLTHSRTMCIYVQFCRPGGGLWEAALNARRWHNAPRRRLCRHCVGVPVLRATSFSASCCVNTSCSTFCVWCGVHKVCVIMRGACVRHGPRCRY